VSDHDAFLRAIRADPDDDTGWLVYADWLDERDDPRGSYVRAYVDWRQAPRDADEFGQLTARLDRLREAVNAQWLALLHGSVQPDDLAGVMALARLNGLLECLAWVERGFDRVGHPVCTFKATLAPRAAPVEVLLAGTWPDWARTVEEAGDWGGLTEGVTELHDWPEALRESLNGWVFSRRDPPNGRPLTREEHQQNWDLPEYRDKLFDTVLTAVRDVLAPDQVFHFRRGGYKILKEAFAFARSDRVLLLEFESVE
jgi:uncharacterized protein (TIGR02996 family)